MSFEVTGAMARPQALGGKESAATIFDTDGEVSFASANALTNLVFKLVPNVNRVHFRLRHQ